MEQILADPAAQPSPPRDPPRFEDYELAFSLNALAQGNMREEQRLDIYAKWRSDASDAQTVSLDIFARWIVRRIKHSSAYPLHGISTSVGVTSMYFLELLLRGRSTSSTSQMQGRSSVRAEENWNPK